MCSSASIILPYLARFDYIRQVEVDQVLAFFPFDFHVSGFDPGLPDHRQRIFISFRSFPAIARPGRAAGHGYWPFWPDKNKSFRDAEDIVAIDYDNDLGWTKFFNLVSDELP